MKKISIGISVVVIIGAIIGVFLWQSPSEKNSAADKATESVDRSAILYIGAIATSKSEMAEKRDRYRLFDAYLEEHLKSSGIEKIELVLAKNAVEMAKLMRQGKIDLVSESPFQAFVLNSLAGAEPLLARWKKGVEKYNSVFYSARGSVLTSLDDLKGNVLVFEDTGSTSAYLLPKAYLMSLGYELVEVSNTSDKPPPGKIGYYFEGDEVDMVRVVVENKNLAGATNWTDIDGYLKGAQKNRNAVQVIAETPMILRNVMLVQRRMSADLKAAIIAALLKMSSDEKGKAALKAYGKTTRFSELKPNPQAVFRPIKKLGDLVEREILGL